MALSSIILGSGLGKDIGFPDGPQLKALIIKELDEHEKELRRVLEWSHVFFTRNVTANTFTLAPFWNV